MHVLRGAVGGGGCGVSAQKQKRAANMCAICGKRVYLSPGKGRSSGWVKGDVFGIPQMMQVHTDCYFAKLDALQDGVEVVA